MTEKLTRFLFPLWLCVCVFFVCVSYTWVGDGRTDMRDCRLGANVQGEVHLLKSVNKFAFLAFLFANVLTGVVNSTLNTLVAGTATALVTLSLYMVGVCCLTHVLYVRRAQLSQSLFRLSLGKRKKIHSPESEL
mmetsp:Transcript_11915/g.30869  ORF Transcript_11915/g.30869 Transcript_11915/m.30869 type:complete len:134 (-) Transcript_11915:90-491(-)